MNSVSYNSQRPLRSSRKISNESRNCDAAIVASRGYLITTLLLLLCGVAAVVPESGHQHTAIIGQIFSLENSASVNPLLTDTLPEWVGALKTRDDRLTASGIPQLVNIGRHYVATLNGDTEEIEVIEETQPACENGRTTTWIEILTDQRLGAVATAGENVMEKQIELVDRLFVALNASIRELDNRREDFRLLPLNYLSRYRQLVEMISDDFADDDIDLMTDGDRLIVALNISCGELSDYGNDVISVVAETSSSFRILSGHLNRGRIPIRTTTTSPSRRTTRQSTAYQPLDNRPAILNRLSTFRCKRGILCRLEIPDNVFVDAEDGPTSRLRLSVHSIDGKRNFFVALPYSNYVEGVPIAVGTHGFRIEARDRVNQTVSLPFEVEVGDSPTPNHQFVTYLDTTLDKFFVRVDAVRDFVYRLSASLRGARDTTAIGATAANGGAGAVFVDGVTTAPDDPNQVIIRWSNASFSRRVCQERLINDTRVLMLAGKNFDRVRHEFRRLMGAQFHVKKIALELMGSCGAPPRITTIRVKATTTRTSIDAEPASSSATLADMLFVPLVFLALLFLVLTLLVLLYCCVRKNQLQRKKKQQQGDFVSKGLPIVFPEEVPHDDDDDSTAAALTTPMLVSREQPPIDPSRMTLHENPLYKPPPTTQATLTQLPPRILQPPVNPMSTFSTPPPSGGGGRGIGSTPAANMAMVGQRLPPPYVAAL